MEIRDFLLWAHMASGASPAMVRRIMTAVANKMPLTPATIIECASPKVRRRLTAWFADSKNQQKVARANATAHIVYTDDAYPERLRELTQPPIVLFYRGDLTLLKRPSLGIVGARLATDYSAGVIEEALGLVQRDTVIVSGLARGADSMGHRQALKSGLGTIAVIANGVDVYYPAEHRQLQEQIAINGLLLSEYPPGERPKQYRFVARNRIIAGLSHTLLVTEAAEKSGSLITATMALEAGRDVLAAPNQYRNPLGIGTNKLIEDGATPVSPKTDWTNIHYFD